MHLHIKVLNYHKTVIDIVREMKSSSHDMINDSVMSGTTCKCIGITVQVRKCGMFLLEMGKIDPKIRTLKTYLPSGYYYIEIFC